MTKNHFNILAHLTAARAFEAVARLGSMKLAAAELCVTESAVSRLVRQLEDFSGVVLFERKHRRLELTEIGRLVAAELTPALDQIRRASSIITERQTNKPLVIAAPATFLLRWLIPRQSSLQSLIPHTPIRLATWDAPPNPQDASVSIFVAIGEASSVPSATRFDVMPETFGLVLSPLLLKDDVVLEGVLARVPRLTPRTRPSIWSDWIHEGGIDAPYSKVLEFERMFFTLQAAEAAVGSTIAPLEVVADDLASGRLTAPFGAIRRRGSYHLLVANRLLGSSDVKTALRWFAAEGAATQQKLHSVLPKT